MDHDEDHREPRGSYEAWLREQRAANECECGAWKAVADAACWRCTPDEDEPDP